MTKAEWYGLRGLSWSGSSFRYRHWDNQRQCWIWVPQIQISVLDCDTIQDSATTVAILKKNIEMFLQAEGNEHVREIWITTGTNGFQF